MDLLIERYAKAGDPDDCGHELAGSRKAGKFDKGNTCAAGGGGRKEAKSRGMKAQEWGRGRRPTDADLPEQYRGILDQEDLDSMNEKQFHEMVRLADESVANKSKYLPDVEELMALAKMGESVRGQYEYGGRFLRAAFESKGFGGDVAESIAKVWQAANSIFSARTGWKIHTAAATALTHLWLENGMPTRADGVEGKYKIKEIIDAVRKHKKANGAYAHPFDRTKRRKIMELLWNAPDVNGRIRELIKADKWGKTVNFGEAWTKAGSVPIDAWMGALLKPDAIFPKKSAHTLGEMMDYTSPGSGKTPKTVAKTLENIRSFRQDVMSNAAKYHAYKLAVGKAAEQLGWEPRQVQETVWAAAMGIGMLRAAGVKSPDLVNTFTHEMAKESWDMKGVFNDQEYFAGLLRDADDKPTLKALQRWARGAEKGRKHLQGEVRLSPQERRAAARAVERLPAAEKQTIVGRKVYKPGEGGKAVPMLNEKGEPIEWRNKAKAPTEKDIATAKKKQAQDRDKHKEAARKNRKKAVKARAAAWKKNPKLRQKWEQERDRRIAERAARMRRRAGLRRFMAGDSGDCGHDPDGDFSLNNVCQTLHGNIRHHEKHAGLYNMNSRFKSRLERRLWEVHNALEDNPDDPQLQNEEREITDTLHTMARVGRSRYDIEHRNMKKMDFIKDAYRRLKMVHDAGESMDVHSRKRINAAAEGLKRAYGQMARGEDASQAISHVAGLLHLAHRNTHENRHHGELGEVKNNVRDLSTSMYKERPKPSHFSLPLTHSRPRSGRPFVSRFQGYFREGGVNISDDNGILTGNQVAVILADQHGNRLANRGHGVSPGYMKNKWIVSEKFVLMKLPIWLVSPYKWVSPKDPSHSSGPIIVDANKRGSKLRLGSFGSSLDVMIIDGKHRYYQARRAGKKEIEAYVGDKVVDLVREIIDRYGPGRQLFADAVEGYYEDPDIVTQAALIKAGGDAGLRDNQIYKLMDNFHHGVIFDLASGTFRESEHISSR